jgi:hypothetical protein
MKNITYIKKWIKLINRFYSFFIISFYEIIINEGVTAITKNVMIMIIENRDKN